MSNHKTTDEELQKLLEMLDRRVNQGQSIAWDDLVEAAEAATGRRYTRQGLFKLRVFGERVEKIRKTQKKSVSDEEKSENFEKTRLKNLLSINEELINAMIKMGESSPIANARLIEMGQEIQRQRIDG